MYNIDEKIVAIKKYLKKLLMIMDNEAVLVLFKTKFVNKKRIDDVLCCIEASFPDEYKNFIKNGRQLKSNNYYIRLLQIIRTNTWLNSSWYSIHYKDAEHYIAATLASIESDIRFVYNNESGLF
ncbi:MAG: hypothetical protein E7Z92_03495 [Cyanobacteria bacterium SIG31]|nr:hypothetical protein [Cyanobacteria bacterium SIG31]